MWNHFFLTWLLLGSSGEVVVGVDIYAKSRPGVDPYFHLPISRSMDGWQKVWIFLRNEAEAPLLVFMGSCPGPQPN
jgi:hypothetical protein